MNDLKKNYPLWKWILLIVFGSFFFLILSQFAPIIGSFSNNVWVKSVLLLLGGLLILGVYAAYVRIFEKRQVSELAVKRALPDLLIGIGIGVLFISGVVGLLALSGVYKIDSVEFNAPQLLLNFAALSIVAISEEIIFRGIIFRMIDGRFNLLSALILSSLIFGLMHLTVVDLWTAIAISAEAGLMLAAAYKLRNNLWIPIGIHWAWNFMLGSIFGVGVSGFVEEYSLFIPQISGPYIFTGGNNGFEGSVVTLCVGIIVGLLLLYDKNMKVFISRREIK